MVIILALLSIIFLGATLYFFCQQLNLQKESSDLKKELKIQSNSLQHIKEESFQEEGRLHSLLVVISDLAKDLNSELEEDKIMAIISEELVKLLGVEKCAIFGVSEISCQLHYLYSFGYDKEKLSSLVFPIDKKSNFLGWAAENGLPVSNYDVEHDVKMAELARLNPFPIAFCQPLILDRKVIAVIAVDKIRNKTEQAEILRIFSSFSNFGAIAINNSRLMQNFRERSIKDSLTGLYNHGYFQNFLQERLKAQKEEKKLLSLAMLDIDFFKQLNDAHGHQAGDFILLEIANIFREVLDKGDLICRYGGEEFSIVFLNKDIQKAFELSEALRKRISQANFSYQGQSIKVTISIGIAGYYPDKRPYIEKNELIKEADTALYKAKSEGKNKTVVYNV